MVSETKAHSHTCTHSYECREWEWGQCMQCMHCTKENCEEVHHAPTNVLDAKFT